MSRSAILKSGGPVEKSTLAYYRGLQEAIGDLVHRLSCGEVSEEEYRTAYRELRERMDEVLERL